MFGKSGKFTYLPIALLFVYVLHAQESNTARANLGDHLYCSAIDQQGIANFQGGLCELQVQTSEESHFAVIGDYGFAGQPEEDVANLVKSWNPDFVITVGDNNYPSGSASTIDQNIGQYYEEFIYPYAGSYGSGSTSNRFFPTLGNHDWDTSNALPYLNYFLLSGNERYYDFVLGPVHFFAIDSDPREPAGISSTSVQAQWLKDRLASSTAQWKIVYMHHPPFSSGLHGSNTITQWPFAEWGADAVLAGHDHSYERIFRNHLPYFVNGAGGRSLYPFGTIVDGSQSRFNADYGAMLVDATETQISFRFITRTGLVTDTYSLETQHPSSFLDVPVSHPYYEDIETLYANGYTAGCATSPLQFCPDLTMNRAQSAVFMVRGNFGGGYVPVTPTHFFGDNWSNTAWAEGWAESMFLEGLTGGCSTSPLLFCPEELFTNVQAAVFGLRMKHGVPYQPPAASGAVFADLTDLNFWGTPWAEQAYAEGLLPACGTSAGKPLFCPNNLVSRGFGAAVIVKAKNLTIP